MSCTRVTHAGHVLPNRNVRWAMPRPLCAAPSLWPAAPRLRCSSSTRSTRWCATVARAAAAAAAMHPARWVQGNRIEHLLEFSCQGSLSRLLSSRKEVFLPAHNLCNFFHGVKWFALAESSRLLRAYFRWKHESSPRS